VIKARDYLSVYNSPDFQIFIKKMNFPKYLRFSKNNSIKQTTYVDVKLAFTGLQVNFA
jgi:hypothetical protein